MTRKRTWLDANAKRLPGLVTVVWLCVILGYGAFRWYAVGGWPSPNTVGDFLAGAFSPVAFLWLILGYRQQGEELAFNTNALRDQAQELKQSVLAQESLAAAMREQNEITERHASAESLRRKRQGQPAFEIALTALQRQDHDFFVARFTFTNRGAPCAGLFITVADNGVASTYVDVGYLDSQKQATLELQVRGPANHELSMTFVYTDFEAEHQVQKVVAMLIRDATGDTFEFDDPGQTKWRAPT